MKNLLNPRWIFLINTLPVVIMLLLFWGDYAIINTLLNEENKKYWLYFGISISILSCISTIYALIITLLKRELSIIYSTVTLTLYAGYVIIFFSYANDIIPFDVPRWMLNGESAYRTLTYLMPTIIHAIFINVINFKKYRNNENVTEGLLYILLVPTITFIFFQVIFLLEKTSFKYHHLSMIFIWSLVIIGALFIVHAIANGIYFLSDSKQAFLKNYELYWKVPFTILFPIAGLLVNQGMDNMFGNFESYWFYFIALFNGILICLPQSENKNIRLLQFIGKSALFGYTLYFFLIFLPFLPFSLLALIFFGAGFLMLAPLILFIIHTNSMFYDFQFLKNFIPKTILNSIIILGLLVFPIYFTIQFRFDKITLDETFNYLYTPNYSSNYKIDTNSLANTLNFIKE